MSPRPQQRRRIPEQNYIPKFLEELLDLVNYYTTTSINPEKGFRAVTFLKAVNALVDQYVTCIDDIDTEELHKLPGVGKSTLDLLREFITSGKIEILDDFRQSRFWRDAELSLKRAIRELPQYYPGYELSLDDQGRLLLNGRTYYGRTDNGFIMDEAGRTPLTRYIGLQDEGLPFTFEYKGHSFEIDGLYDIERSYGGFVNFTGTIVSVEKHECENLSFKYDHGFGNRQEFDHFSCPMIDDEGAFMDDDNNNDDENWYQVVKDAVNAAFIFKDEWEA
jgi:hypothetical protein